MRGQRVTGVVVALLALAAAVRANGQEREEQTLIVGEQVTYEPGYAVGDIAIVDVNIADYRVERGRRTLLLLGKKRGQTTLNITDQRRVLRTIVTITVQGREEADLQQLLQGYPNVSIRRIGDKPVLMGTVASKADLDMVEKMASVAGVDSLVRVSLGGTAANSSGADHAAAGTPHIEYEIDILEASATFHSGSYGTGVEPSGRSLFKQVVAVPVGGTADVYVPGGAVSDEARKKGVPKSGIRLTLEPGELSDSGSFITFVAVETNVPVEQSPDPAVTRRARWEMEVSLDEPFALAGAHLLAVPAAVESGGSKFSSAVRTARTLTGLPGVRSTGARQYTTGIPYYNKKKKTQVLALFKPRVVRGAQ